MISSSLKSKRLSPKRDDLTWRRINLTQVENYLIPKNKGDLLYLMNEKCCVES
jgi:hypothetical protein